VPGEHRRRAGAGAPGGSDAGYSRRLLVRAFRSEKQDHWLQTLEEGFRHWGGVPQEVLVDNARALVSQHDPERNILVFADRLEEFARY